VTGNKEWYDPRAVTTSGGSLTITFSKEPEHGLGFTGGMIQTWNKFCFTGGLIETRVMMPGLASLSGMWPAVWTMGNLGRAGYAATTDGLVSLPAVPVIIPSHSSSQWPFTYDTCDVGTVANQSLNGVPAAAGPGNGGDSAFKGQLSVLPGQRLSRCTCEEDADLHPGPKHDDGTFVGRSAPEIDVFEQQVGLVQKGMAEVSQSAQFAPFNWKYTWTNLTTTDTWGIIDDTITKPNSYLGGA
jgi:beta-glucan synthesis-associated protein KRE6